MNESQIEIREERPADVDAIRGVNVRAFARPHEADIVDALRASGSVLLSLVAVLDGQIVGHILYSPVTVGDISGAGLAPMAVVPEHQRRGIGSRLVEAGNRILEARGCPFVVVLGHADFYPRFGFEPAGAHGVTCKWPVPDNAFMLLVLDPGVSPRLSGLAKYRPEF